MQIGELLNKKISERQKRQCIGKSRLQTKDAARKSAYEFFVISGDRMNHYLCKYCGFYHIGHK